MNTILSPEISKLLKEKGFEQIFEVGVICRIQNKISKNYEETRPLRNSDLTNEWSILNEIYPTIAEVVMWLYEKQIDLCHIVNYKNGFRTYRMGIIYIKDNKIETVFIRPKDNKVDFIEFNSPTEAYEAAIKYTLTELI